MAAATLSSLATGLTRYVDDDGRAGRAGCDGTRTVARKVQRAIDSAGPGDTILVCPGTYTEQLTITGVRDGLTIKAVEPWTAIIRTPRSLSGSPSTLITIDGVDRVLVQWRESFPRQDRRVEQGEVGRIRRLEQRQPRYA